MVKSYVIPPNVVKAALAFAKDDESRPSIYGIAVLVHDDDGRVEVSATDGCQMYTHQMKNAKQMPVYPDVRRIAPEEGRLNCRVRVLYRELLDAVTAVPSSKEGDELLLLCFEPRGTEEGVLEITGALGAKVSVPVLHAQLLGHQQVSMPKAALLKAIKGLGSDYNVRSLNRICPEMEICFVGDSDHELLCVPLLLRWAYASDTTILVMPNGRKAPAPVKKGR